MFTSLAVSACVWKSDLDRSARDRKIEWWSARLQSYVGHSYRISVNVVWRTARHIKLPGFAPIFPDICYHLTHYKPAAADIPVASDNPAHYADAIRYNARTPLQGSLLPLTRLVWA